MKMLCVKDKIKEIDRIKQYFYFGNFQIYITDSFILHNNHKNYWINIKLMKQHKKEIKKIKEKYRKEFKFDIREKLRLRCYKDKELRKIKLLIDKELKEVIIDKIDFGVNKLWYKYKGYYFIEYIKIKDFNLMRQLEKNEVINQRITNLYNFLKKKDKMRQELIKRYMKIYQEQELIKKI